MKSNSLQNLMKIQFKTLLCLCMALQLTTANLFAGERERQGRPLKQAPTRGGYFTSPNYQGGQNRGSTQFRNQPQQPRPQPQLQPQPRPQPQQPFQQGRQQFQRPQQRQQPQQQAPRQNFINQNANRPPPPPPPNSQNNFHPHFDGRRQIFNNQTVYNQRFHQTNITNIYVQPRTFGGYHYWHHSPGISFTGLFIGAALTTVAVVAVYDWAYHPRHIVLAPAYWSAYPCDPYWGCYYAPRTVIEYPYQVVTDSVVLSYSQDLHDRLVAHNAVEDYKAQMGMDQQTQNDVRALDQQLDREIEAKVVKSLELQKNKVNQSSDDSSNSNDIPENLKPGQLVIVNRHMIFKDSSEQECSLVETDKLRIQEYRQENYTNEQGEDQTGLVSVLKVERALPRNTACANGSIVKIAFKNVIEMENVFQAKVEQKLVDTKKAHP